MRELGGGAPVASVGEGKLSVSFAQSGAGSANLGSTKYGAAKKSIGDLVIDGKAFSSAIEKLMGVLSEAQFITLLRRLFELTGATYTDRAGKQRHIQFGGGNFEVAMEEVFAGKLFTIYPVILLVLEANYPDFFDKVVRGIGQRIAAITTSAPAEPSGSEPLPASESSAG